MVQPTGKIVVSGWWTQDFPNGKPISILARYKTDGSRDPTFGKAGILATPGAGSVLMQSDGKILEIESGPTLVRRSPNGSLDSSFGSGGAVQLPFASALGLALQPDGRIVVLCSSGYLYPPALIRYSATGVLDRGFGKGGVVWAPRQMDGPQVAVQTDGKIVLGGAVQPDSGAGALAVVRYHADGTLDTDFGSGGMTTTEVGGDVTLSEAIALQPDGGIVQLGEAVCESDCGGESCEGADFLIRLKPDGSLDSKSSPFVVPAPGGSVQLCGASDLVVRRNGQLIVAVNGATENFQPVGAVARLNENGVLDHHFGTAGLLIVHKASFSGVALQPDGKILAAGDVVGKNSNPRFLLARLLAGTERCLVPNVKGKALRKATRTLNRSYCLLGRVKRAFSRTVRIGHVVSQHPNPGARRPARTNVKLVISKGKPRGH